MASRYRMLSFMFQKEEYLYVSSVTLPLSERAGFLEFLTLLQKEGSETLFQRMLKHTLLLSKRQSYCSVVLMYLIIAYRLVGWMFRIAQLNCSNQTH